MILIQFHLVDRRDDKEISHWEGGGAKKFQEHLTQLICERPPSYGEKLGWFGHCVPFGTRHVCCRGSTVRVRMVATVSAWRGSCAGCSTAITSARSASTRGSWSAAVRSHTATVFSSKLSLAFLLYWMSNVFLTRLEKFKMTHFNRIHKTCNLVSVRCWISFFES